MSDTSSSEKDFREKLLRLVKKEVKQIMEEAVTRKFVHEESSSITSLCAAVDACLSHGLKRRALGLFKTNSTTALLQKVTKSYKPAEIIYRMVVEIENSDPNKRSSSSSDSTNRLKNKQTSVVNSNAKPVRYLWIRIALFEKQLVNIVDHVVQHSNQYYEKEALVADPVCGQILASLLVGPCALDYSKMKTQDHFWTDPPADELVQRHRLSSPLLNGPSTPSATRKPLGLPYKRTTGRDIPVRPSSMSDDSGSPRSNPPWSPRDYVESLHQNCKSTLLYGKNNVIVQPKENLKPIPGYLSLHQTPNGLVIKWTPNQLMNGSLVSSETPEPSQDKSVFWEFAMTVSVEEIVYLHCHQQESAGSIVLVAQDGVQYPPIVFPKGGHLLSFLSCLENGLMPYGQLDPPLWSKKGKGKVFPLLRRKGQSSSIRTSKENSSTDSETEAMDYVFRIVATFDKPESISPEMFDPKTTKGGSYLWRPQSALKHRSTTSSTSSTLSSKSSNEESSGMTQGETGTLTKEDSLPTDKTIQLLCETMKRQIISRAFYGWLAHCRHLRTVRTHLAALVNSRIVSASEPRDVSGGLTEEIWISMHTEDGRVEDKEEILRMIYFGGCSHSIRKEVWPYLLGHYKFGSTYKEREEENQKVSQHYEVTMTEWLAVEAIVRQRDKEIVAANLAKLSSESTTSTDMPLTGPKDASRNESNEVFMDSSSDEEEDGDEVHMEGKQEEFKENSSEEGMLQRQSSTERLPAQTRSILVTNPSVDTSKSGGTPSDEHRIKENGIPEECEKLNVHFEGNEDGQLSVDHSACASPASSGGGVYSNELLDLFSLNLHRIDKDVQRCDRSFWYFADKNNLEKLRNVMCTYVWENLDQGYVQGMCDLVAPLLVIFDDEVQSYSCFCELMKRMVANFPHGGAMDSHFANMRSLIQILDNDIFELMHQNGDYTHFYFCYRWFLLDFKRELVYDDVFRVWEAIWSAKEIASPNFVLFIALALVEYYRDIILENNMDFTDIIKFFNEMAERHDAEAVLKIARDLVLQIQTLIDNK